MWHLLGGTLLAEAEGAFLRVKAQVFSMAQHVHGGALAGDGTEFVGGHMKVQPGVGHAMCLKAEGRGQVGWVCSTQQPFAMGALREDEMRSGSC